MMVEIWSGGEFQFVIGFLKCFAHVVSVEGFATVMPMVTQNCFKWSSRQGYIIVYGIL